MGAVVDAMQCFDAKVQSKVARKSRGAVPIHRPAGPPCKLLHAGRAPSQQLTLNGSPLVRAAICRTHRVLHRLVRDGAHHQFCQLARIQCKQLPLTAGGPCRKQRVSLLTQTAFRLPAKTTASESENQRLRSAARTGKLRACVCSKRAKQTKCCRYGDLIEN